MSIGADKQVNASENSILRSAGIISNLTQIAKTINTNKWFQIFLINEPIFKKIKNIPKFIYNNLNHLIKIYFLFKL